MSTIAQKASAFTLTKQSTDDLIAEGRRQMAARRAKRAAEEAAKNIVAVDRRFGPADRRAPREIETSVGGMTMERRLAITDRRRSEARFTGAPVTELGGL